MENETVGKTEEKNEPKEDTARQLVESQLEEVNKIALEYEQTSKKMVSRSISYDALTVIFGAASPALTTYVAYEDNIGPFGSVIKLGVILVVAIAVSLPALKRILGIKKHATHASASAMDLRRAISDVHNELGRIVEDVKEEKQEKYYIDQVEKLKSKVSEVRQKYSRLVFDIMEESHGIAEQESKKISPPKLSEPKS